MSTRPFEVLVCIHSLVFSGVVTFVVNYSHSPRWRSFTVMVPRWWLAKSEPVVKGLGFRSQSVERVNHDSYWAAMPHSVSQPLTVLCPWYGVKKEGLRSRCASIFHPHCIHSNIAIFYGYSVSSLHRGSLDNLGRRIHL